MEGEALPAKEERNEKGDISQRWEAIEKMQFQLKEEIRMRDILEKHNKGQEEKMDEIKVQNNEQAIKIVKMELRNEENKKRIEDKRLK